MRWLGVGGAIAIVATLMCAAWWHSNGATFGDPPTEIRYHGCNYRNHQKRMSLDQAVTFEHQAPYYARTPVAEVGRTPAGRPFYGLTIGEGDTTCSRSPLDIYLQLPVGMVQQYMRGGGP